MTTANLGLNKFHDEPLVLNVGPVDADLHSHWVEHVQNDVAGSLRAVLMTQLHTCCVQTDRPCYICSKRPHLDLLMMTCTDICRTTSPVVCVHSPSLPLPLLPTAP